MSSFLEVTARVRLRTDLLKQAWHIFPTVEEKKMTAVRKGQAPAKLEPGEFVQAVAVPVNV